MEINETQTYNAEFAALNHEIYRLNKLLDAKEKEITESGRTDPYDPFRNPTEFRWYRDDYAEILPWITMPEFAVPFEPVKVEKQTIRKYYNIGGFMALYHFFGSNILVILLMYAIKGILTVMNPKASSGAVSHYMEKGASFVALNMIVFIIINVSGAFLALKWAKIKPSHMINTRDYSFAAALQHCFAGLFIWAVAVYSALGIENIFSKYDYSTIISDSDYGTTGLGIAIMAIYSCLIAPVTEELFFRGALMKIFSKSNQRFGIFASAVFFGFAHENIPQFILAFLVGIFFGHIDMKHNSILPSVVVHIFLNTLVTLTSYLDEGSPEMTGASLLMLLGAVIGLFMLISFRKGCPLPVSTPAQSRRGVAIAKTSVGIILALVFQLLYMLLLILTTKS